MRGTYVVKQRASALCLSLDGTSLTMPLTYALFTCCPQGPVKPPWHAPPATCT